MKLSILFTITPYLNLRIGKYSAKMRIFQTATHTAAFTLAIHVDDTLRMKNNFTNQSQLRGKLNCLEIPTFSPPDFFASHWDSGANWINHL